MRTDLPIPPTLGEPILKTYLRPNRPQEFGKWAQSLSEVAEQKPSRGGNRGKMRVARKEFKGPSRGLQEGGEKVCATEY